MVYFFRRKRCWNSFKCIPYLQEKKKKPKAGAVYGVQPMRATTVNFVSFLLDEKGLVRSFPAILFDFVSRNNGSWAF